jgi:3-phosphoshikimate 1-carboxyvinyltransferase
MTDTPKIQGTLTAPASKSMTQRAIAAALLAGGESLISNASLCDDARAALALARALGAETFEAHGQLHISRPFAVREKELNCRESALCVRLFAPIAALLAGTVSLRGQGTLCARPLPDVAATLPAFGVQVTPSSHKGLPMQLSGFLQPAVATIDASESSQLLSGLLMALPLLAGDSELTVTGLVSRPYVAMTLDIIRHFGGEVACRRFEVFTIKGRQRYRPQTCLVEGDWSSAAFLLAGAAIGGSITLKGLQRNSRQADRAILPALQAAGARVSWHQGAVHVCRGQRQAFRFDATDCPDLFPPLVLLAAFCEGVSVLKGAHRLVHKESNRAQALQEIFGRLGIQVSLQNDEMLVYGGAVHGGRVSSFHDHRMAMAAACAGLFTPEPVEIDDTDCVRKSYPGFFTDLKQLQA